MRYRSVGRSPTACGSGTSSRYRSVALSAALFALALFAGSRMRRNDETRFPPLAQLQTGPFVFQDTAFAAAGFRAPAADLAWIQLLQYAAGGIPELPDRPGRPYDHLANMSRRVTRLDPSFHRAALFGAGILAWFRGVERPDEAVDILNEGMRRTPKQPLYSLYIAALAYKKEGDTERMIALLESSFDLPETPSQVKTIFANLRQSRGQYREAIALWERIQDNERDASEHPRARRKIAELRALLRAPRAKSQ